MIAQEVKTTVTENTPLFTSPGAATVVDGRWSTGLCDCLLDVPSCAEAFFCSVCQESRQFNMATKREPEVDWFICGGIYLAEMVTGCGVGGMAWYLRRTVRQRYGIMGDDVTDGVAAICCPILVIAQNHREMALRGEWPQGFCVSRPFGVYDAAPAGTVHVGRPLGTAEQQPYGSVR